MFAEFANRANVMLQNPGKLDAPWVRPLEYGRLRKRTD
jgi:hypothetical protein